MYRIGFIVLITLVPFMTYSQTNSKQLIGEYHSRNKKIDSWSILRLHENDRFEYSYGLGGCQAFITGRWLVKENRLYLFNDNEFRTNYSNPADTLLINDSIDVYLPRPLYPDLSLIDWIIGKNWIRPNGFIETGCFYEFGKHKKK